jgi:hypothetical protein
MSTNTGLENKGNLAAAADLWLAAPRAQFPFSTLRCTTASAAVLLGVTDGGAVGIRRET